MYKVTTFGLLGSTETYMYAICTWKMCTTMDSYVDLEVHNTVFLIFAHCLWNHVHKKDNERIL